MRQTHTHMHVVRQRKRQGRVEEDGPVAIESAGLARHVRFQVSVSNRTVGRIANVATISSVHVHTHKMLHKRFSGMEYSTW